MGANVSGPPGVEHLRKMFSPLNQRPVSSLVFYFLDPTMTYFNRSTRLMMQGTKQFLERGLVQCGGGHCTQTVQNNGADLLQCAR